MIEFNTGDQIKVNFDNRRNKDKNEDTVRFFCQYLTSHANVFTVRKCHKFPKGNCLVYLEEVDGGFFSDRFLPIEVDDSSNITVTDEDLEGLLNG